ncbi:MAG: CoA ester lyase [Pseudomonadales bacterium]|nr:CoA ester lyase [Pseudomonadales bacterium]
MTPGANRLRRSLHFVPGASEKMLHKSLDTRADGLVLDLEDAVTPDRKDEARRVVAAWLADVDFRGKERTVRINPLTTPWGLADVRATMQHPPDAYVVPKVSSLDELMTLDKAIHALEVEYGHSPGGVGLILVSTETARGALNVSTFPDCHRVIALSWGAEDLSAALGATGNRLPDGSYMEVFRHCRTMTLLSAVAGNVQPLDTVFVDIRDHAGLERESLEGAWMGFTGKITIHPAQIDIVNKAFTPSVAVVETARRLVEAFAEEEKQGRMAFSFEGQMVDVPHLTRARRLLERHAQIIAAGG